MGSPKIKAQGQSQGHVTSAIMCYFLKKKTMKTHGLLDLVYRFVYINQCIHSKLYL